jgi:putative transposase
VTEAGVAYHLLNRRVMRLPIFESAADYEAFEGVLLESLSRPDAPRLLAYCLMPNHWHLVVQAGGRTNLSTWMQWVTVTHTHRWHAHRRTTGEGPLYQGRFKSFFPTQQDAHFLTVCRYVEANAVRARLVKQAENWRWCSLWAREHRGSVMHACLAD